MKTPRLQKGALICSTLLPLGASCSPGVRSNDQAPAPDGGGTGTVSSGSSGGGTVVSDAGAASDSSASGESPNCTVVTKTGETITDASGNQWTLEGPSTNLVVYMNGKLAGYSANVTQLLYVAHALSQENAAGGWWDWANGTWNTESDPSASCTNSADAGGTSNDAGGGTSDSGAPPQAVAAGYTTLVGGAEFNSPSDVTNDLSGNTVAAFYNDVQGANVVTGYSIANGVLNITADTNGWGAGFSSVANQSLAATSIAPVSTNGITKPNGNGLAWRYGYFEFSLTCSFTAPNGSSYYPTGWLYSVDTDIPFMELDVFELYGGNPYGMLIGWPQAIAPSEEQDGNRITLPPMSALDLSPGAYNRYGVLWTPTFVQYFWNDVPGQAVPMNSSVSFNDGNSYVPNTLMNIDQQFVYAIFGTGSSWPVSYDYVRVWQ